MHSVEILKATQQDIDGIFMLVKHLAEYEKAADEVTVSKKHFKEMGFGPHKVWDAFVAKINTKVVAMALYYTRFSTWKGSMLYLEDLYVMPKHRGKGIGKKLFHQVCHAAKFKNMHFIAFQVLDWNQPAIDFYKSLGAKKEKINFDAQWINVTFDVSRM